MLALLAPPALLLVHTSGQLELWRPLVITALLFIIIQAAQVTAAAATTAPAQPAQAEEQVARAAQVMDGQREAVVAQYEQTVDARRGDLVARLGDGQEEQGNSEASVENCYELSELTPGRMNGRA